MKTADSNTKELSELSPKKRAAANQPPATEVNKRALAHKLLEKKNHPLDEPKRQD